VCEGVENTKYHGVDGPCSTYFYVPSKKYQTHIPMVHEASHDTPTYVVYTNLIHSYTSTTVCGAVAVPR